MKVVIPNRFCNNPEAIPVVRKLYPYILSLLLFTAVGASSCGSESASEPTPADTTGQNDTIDTTHITDSTDTIDGDTLRTGSFDGEKGADGRCVWVAPYRKSDGSCVRGHWRSSPGETCPWVGTVYKDCD